MAPRFTVGTVPNHPSLRGNAILIHHKIDNHRGRVGTLGQEYAYVQVRYIGIFIKGTIPCYLPFKFVCIKTINQLQAPYLKSKTPMQYKKKLRENIGTGSA